VIRSIRIIFCDNEHGIGDQTFPDTREIQPHHFTDGPVSAALRRKEAKKAGWGRVAGLDYCPICMESEK
jgi:hypothetical protein